MRKILGALFVLAMIAALAGAASADAGGGCIGGKCDADAVAVADVNVTIDGPGKVYVGDVANFTVTIDFNSFAWAEAYAKGLIGYTEAYAYAYADGLAYGTVTDPSGNIVASKFSLEGDSDWDWDSDSGWLPYSEAGAYAEFPETVTFNFGVKVTEEGEWAIYAYGDSIAYAFAYSDYWVMWFGKYCDAYGYDFDWDEAFLYFWAQLRDYHGRRVNFALAPTDGVIQPSPLPVWGSCSGECSNYDGHFPFVTMIPGVNFTLDYWYPGVAPYTAGVFRTLKKGADIPLTLWLRENPTDGKMYYCNVALEDGRDYVMSGGMDCE